MVTVVPWLFIYSGIKGVREANKCRHTESSSSSVCFTHAENGLPQFLGHLGSTKYDLWFIMYDHGLNSRSWIPIRAFYLQKCVCLSSLSGLFQQYKSYFCLLALVLKKMFAFYIHSYHSQEESWK